MDERLVKIRDYLKNYKGPDIKLMEVCGSHTAAISKSGIKSIVSERIHLVSGPGCPVCVTPSAYIDRLIEIAMEDNMQVATFGDLIRVPGSKESLSQAKGRGAKVEMLYSPMDVIDMAKKEKDKIFVFAAVGFETTAPVYALLMDVIVKEQINNIKLLTAIKTMPEVIESLCEKGADIQGFIAPGHVSVITGSEVFEKLAIKYNIPFGVAGFTAEELLIAIYGIVKNIGKPVVNNYYTSVVSSQGNVKAKALIDKYFEKTDAVWRGMGEVKNSGLILRKQYTQYDMGSRDLKEDIKLNKACKCEDVLMGNISSRQCPLFGKICNPMFPQGACMVSEEGSCYQNYLAGNI